jgi:hypothetical protein
MNATTEDSVFYAVHAKAIYSEDQLPLIVGLLLWSALSDNTHPLFREGPPPPSTNS